MKVDCVDKRARRSSGLRQLLRNCHLMTTAGVAELADAQDLKSCE